MDARLVQQELCLDATTPVELCRRLRRGQGAAALLDGSGGFDGAWRPLLALEPRVALLSHRHCGLGPREPLRALCELVRARRERGGSAETGVLALFGYELLDGGASPALDALPEMAVLEVDASVCFPRAGRALLTVPHNAGALDRCRRRVEAAAVEVSLPPPVAHACQAPRTSLPRQRYLDAVGEVQRRIRRGDIYQANLSQQIEAGFAGDPFELYAELVSCTPAPRSAFVQLGDLTVTSVSPETFLRAGPDGSIETRPIKGTRPRGETPAADRAAAQELLDSTKDRAELLMIVDLERNDLSRVCQVGSVRVTELHALRSYPAVHHLVARIEGWLRPEIDLESLFRATFPGGSITGAPKLRAMEILRGLEVVRRNFFTGCLVWLGDDGSLDSSILIRTLAFSGERVWLGAGGGIVADSDPGAEWQESNDKARALTRALGFEPEEAQ